MLVLITDLRSKDGQGVDKEGAGEDEENSADGGDDDRPVGNGEVSGKHARFNDNLMMMLKGFFFKIDSAHPRNPPAKVESKAISPDADQDRDLLVDADKTEHSRESGEKVAGDADATEHVDVVLVSLQGLLVDVEAEVPPVLVSAGHGLKKLLPVLREVVDPEKAAGNDRIRT